MYFKPTKEINHMAIIHNQELFSWKEIEDPAIPGEKIGYKFVMKKSFFLYKKLNFFRRFLT